ncbi:MAG: ABC transporter permease [Bacteroidota bacterium]|nr:ABC transporter permease [Bacteroidota bacterium]MDP4247850.1 ABC transporter permease [Bacteroidota bacterium]
MLRNYFKTALRNLWKNKGFSAINIIGLAVGLATCLLIMLFVMDELGYDRHNKKADRTYRLDGEIKFGGNHFILAVAPAPSGPAMLKDYPEIEQATRFRMRGGVRVRKGSQNVQEDRVVWADSTLFDVFTLPMIAGDPHTALVDPRSLVITEKVANKYFGSASAALGHNLTIDDTITYRISGVIREVPAQSHFRFDFFVPMSGNPDSRDQNWLSNNYNTYIVLRPGADPKRLEAKFGGMITKYIGPLLQQAVHQGVDEFFKAGNSVGFSLMPLTSIHLRSNKEGEMDGNGSIEYVYIFSAVAAFILLIACVNFMNLSTARSSNRAREVGIRKVLGSLRPQLVIQFILESTLISLIAMVFALLLAWLFLPLFNQLAGKQMGIGLLSRPWLAPGLVGLVIVVGLLAGSYPAFFLSAFRPIAVLKGKIASGFRTGWLRNSLVVFQFGISIFLMVGTVVIYNQLHYIRTHDLGFDREHVLIVQNCYPLGDNVRAFKDRLLKEPGVVGATMTGYLPTGYNRNDNAFFLSPALDPKTAISMQVWSVDEQYIPTLGMHLLAGRNFSREFPTDSTGIVINEAAAKMLGSPDPLNRNLYELRDVQSKDLRKWHIVGVIRNFNFNSLRQVVTPMGLFLQEDRGGIALRVRSAHIAQLVSHVEDVWKSMAPGQPFHYSFMDDDFNNHYQTEQRMGSISLSFSLLAICIACLGLFGLATYAAEQRTREIGIRKVLGATVGNLVRLLSTDFLLLVLIAAAIAFPLAWWAMHYWLQGFAYRTGIGWEVFTLAGLLSALIALLTVSFQAIKAALANPVKSLRTE